MENKHKQEEKSPDVFVAGHICLDLLPSFESKAKRQSLDEIFVPGKLNHVGESVLSSGGTVSNTGIALRQLGFSTGLMAKIGDDLFGQGLLRILDDFNEGLQLIVDPASSTSYSIVIAPPGIDRTFLHHPGANDTFSSEDLDYQAIAKAKLFHFGYPPLMRKMYEDEGADLLAILNRVKDTGVSTSLDMAYPDPMSDAGKADWQSILAKCLPYTDIFLPSLEEILYMLRPDEFWELNTKAQDNKCSLIDLYDLKQLDDLAKEIISYGPALLVIKLGHKGLFMKAAGAERLQGAGRAFHDTQTWEDACYFAPSFYVEKIESTTGAGDAAIAGFLSGILAGQEPWLSLQLGCASAAEKIQVRQSFGGINSLEILIKKLSLWEHELVDGIPDQWTYDDKRRIWES